VAVAVLVGEGSSRIGAFRLDVVFDPDSAPFIGLDSLPDGVVVNDAAAASGRVRVAGARPDGLGPTLFAGRFEVQGGAGNPIGLEVIEAVSPDLRRLPVRGAGR
jgi:hypothetical protein